MGYWDSVFLPQVLHQARDVVVECLFLKQLFRTHVLKHNFSERTKI